MSAIRCPQCGETKEPAALVGTVAICGACGSSLVREQDGTIRRAVALDVDALMPGDRASLVKARSSLVRPKR